MMELRIVVTSDDPRLRREIMKAFGHSLARTNMQYGEDGNTTWAVIPAWAHATARARYNHPNIQMQLKKLDSLGVGFALIEVEEPKQEAVEGAGV